MATTARYYLINKWYNIIQSDLVFQDAQAAIPKGTLWAILISMSTYVVMAWMAGSCMLRNAPIVITGLVANLTMQSSGYMAAGDDMSLASCVDTKTCPHGLLNDMQVPETGCGWCTCYMYLLVIVYPVLTKYLLLVLSCFTHVHTCILRYLLFILITHYFSEYLWVLWEYLVICCLQHFMHINQFLDSTECSYITKTRTTDTHCWVLSEVFQQVLLRIHSEDVIVVTRVLIACTLTGAYPSICIQ